MLQATETNSPAVSAGPKQHTLSKPVTVAGPGLLLGEHASVTINPAPAGHGVVFERVDIDPPVKIPAIVTNVARRPRRTTLHVGPVSIETVEHCMSALAGLRVDNVLIQINGPELPCGDGSAGIFVDSILESGLDEQDAARRTFAVTEPLVVEDSGAMIAAFPSTTNAFELVYDLDYGNNSSRIKRQTQSFSSMNGGYEHEIARARTYSLQEEAKALWDRGMCRHLTPRDVLVIGDDGPIDNTYRYDNEPVRHKILDLLGDLYLVGCEVHGRFIACRSGHELNRRLAVLLLEQMEHEQRRVALAHGHEMDIRTIHRILPHRYPMLLVDRVVELEGEQRAIGVKNVTINEPFFQGHYPGTPIMPGVLIVEAMGQLGGLLMSQKLEDTGKIAVLLSLDKVKLRHPVSPGDQLVLEAESVRASARICTMKCKAHVGRKLAAEAIIKFMMVDADQD